MFIIIIIIKIYELLLLLLQQHWMLNMSHTQIFATLPVPVSN